MEYFYDHYSAVCFSHFRQASPNPVWWLFCHLNPLSEVCAKSFWTSMCLWSCYFCNKNSSSQIVRPNTEQMKKTTGQIRKKITKTTTKLILENNSKERPAISTEWNIFHVQKNTNLSFSNRFTLFIHFLLLLRRTCVFIVVKTVFLS